MFLQNQNKKIIFKNNLFKQFFFKIVFKNNFSNTFIFIKY